MPRSAIKSGIGQLLSTSPAAWRLAVSLYNKRARFRDFQGVHPIDRAYGVDTGGSVPAWLLGGGSGSDEHMYGYAGCQPSCLRAALSFLGDDVAGAAFVDLGSGKGRAMVVASEFRFRSIIGVEMSAGLCDVARRNLALVKARGPACEKFEVLCGDALALQYPPGPLVVFLCHSFGLPVVPQVLDRLEEIAGARDELYFVYENPVHGDELDRRPGFERWFARNVPADADELPFHSGLRALGRETVVVWRRSDGTRHTADADAHKQIVIEEEGWRASLL